MDLSFLGFILNLSLFKRRENKWSIYGQLLNIKFGTLSLVTKAMSQIKSKTRNLNRL